MHCYSYLDKNHCLLWMLICSCNCNIKTCICQKPKVNLDHICLHMSRYSFLQPTTQRSDYKQCDKMLGEGTIIVDTNLVILYVLSRSTDSWKPKIFLPGYSSLPWLFTQSAKVVPYPQQQVTQKKQKIYEIKNGHLQRKILKSSTCIL